MKSWTLASSLLLGTCLVIGTAGAQQAQQEMGAEEEQLQTGETMGQQTGETMGQPGTAAGTEQQMQTGTMAAEAPMGLDSETIREIQQALNEAGHDIQVDGMWGPETESALQQFQQEQGIQATGEPDEQTLAMLGVDAQIQPGAGAAGQMQGGTDPLQPGEAELGTEQPAAQQ